jgi:CRISPR-associated endonuclease Csn1
VWLACYVVYGRHSEAKDVMKWTDPKDIDVFLSSFRQHSLNNPIVEQVVTETMRTVRNIWRRVGKIDEVHIELGRDLKRTKEQRVKRTKEIAENDGIDISLILDETHPARANFADLIAAYEVYRNADQIIYELNKTNNSNKNS